MHTFTFLYADSCGQLTINLASWEILHLEPGLEELRIHTSRKDFDIILGSGYLGCFVYLPDPGIAFPIHDLNDTDYSRDHLSDRLDTEEASAISYALQCYASG